MHTRRVSTIAALALVAALMSGCVGEPAPVETTPPFATEDEAFAAAEETYRAYVDALNSVDLSAPATFEPVFALTTGELSNSDRTGLSKYHADGYSVSGESSIDRLQVGEVASDMVRLLVCLDVSDVDVRDENGTSIVDENRVDIQTITVEAIAAPGSPTGALLTSISPREGDPPCGNL